ncbi:uncharacterized protein LOC132263707 [Phlebotomus argentipes]|uniref:uncharacterized protein LOC132263707 n=1 Tax=Phlebotomus argentipes TaxID=94469 RepID=UPI002892F470|nr:uncharacterized protein LOC132263707 [Phlebotomus argentipes]
MKATLWLCTLATTMLCFTQSIRASPAATLQYSDEPRGNELLQDKFEASKRGHASLSIVNPLDVLRKRLLLEIARRQMRENNRQIEINRAILKTIGKKRAEVPPDYVYEHQMDFDADSNPTKKVVLSSLDNDIPVMYNEYRSHKESLF